MEARAHRRRVVTRAPQAGLVAGSLLVLGALAQFAAAQPAQSGDACTANVAVARLPQIGEASGLAVSRRVPGRLWTFNDSGTPLLYALDTDGLVTGSVRLSGAVVEDWEAIAVGPCSEGSCLYVADIGDNQAKRKRVTVYRLPEPAADATSAAVTDVFHATYADGAHDAETLLVTADATMLIVTKGETGPVALYRFPRDAAPGATVELERIGAPWSEKTGKKSRITDGSVSPDGRWTALRTRSELTFFRTADLLAGRWSEVRRVSLAALEEPQGEGVALGADDLVFVAGEGGGKSRPGTFAHFTCTPAL